jgi:ATP-dependent RNA helicase RhlE
MHKNSNSGRNRNAASSTNGSRPNFRNGNTNPGNIQGGGKKKKKPTSLDPEVLRRLALRVEPTTGLTEVAAPISFSQLPLQQILHNAISGKGYKTTTPVQHLAIPPALEGRDILGIAQTGTGKTGAFLIPIIQQLLNDDRQQALILAPTRELAVQIHQEFKELSHQMKFWSACFIGGTNLNKDLNVLQRKQHVIIGTPGRILDLMNRRALRVDQMKILVLDEFDRMLDMGFINDMDKIRMAMSSRRQTMLFSATHDPKQQAEIDRFISNPVWVKVGSGNATSKQISQEFIQLSQNDSKMGRLEDLLKQSDFEKVIVFTETRHQVKNLCKKLKAKGFKADDIHGDKSQNARQKSIHDFGNGRIQVLVATDVAARGLDVNDISHVINFQMPKTEDSYIHRIGRTGRAGKTGVAITFIDAAV